MWESKKHRRSDTEAKGPGNACEPLMAVLVETHCSEKERGSGKVREIGGYQVTAKVSASRFSESGSTCNGAFEKINRTNQ